MVTFFYKSFNVSKIIVQYRSRVGNKLIDCLVKMFFFLMLDLIPIFTVALLCCTRLNYSNYSDGLYCNFYGGWETEKITLLVCAHVIQQTIEVSLISLMSYIIIF